MNTPNVFQRVKFLDKNRCRKRGCSCRSNTQIHHIIPKSQGGKDVEWNLITLCAKHHDRITTKKETNIDLLEPLKKTRNFRWQQSLDWHLQREELTNLKRKRYAK